MPEAEINLLSGSIRVGQLTAIPQRSSQLTWPRSSIKYSRPVCLPTRNGRLCWLSSLLFHAGLVALCAAFGKSFCETPVSEERGPITVTDLEFSPQAVFDTPAKRPDDLLAVLNPAAEVPVVEAVLRDSPDQDVVKDTVATLEDINAAPDGDGQVAQGIADDPSAGSLEALDAPVGGAEVWSRIRLKTIGTGAPGSESGSGNESAASGKGGHGQGHDGIAGNGAGFGTQGATGTGRKGELAGGPPERVFAVEPIKLDMGPYPESARRQGREGIVSLRVEVLADGKTGKIVVLQSSGSNDLDDAAMKAARRWRFKPAKYNGEDTTAWVRISVRYELGTAK